MPKTIKQDKARAIAEAYCTNGFCKKDALLAVGYKEPFSKSSFGSRMFDKPIIRAEIDAIMSRNAEVCDVEVGEIIQGLRSIAFPDEGVQVNNSDRNRALELLGKYKCIWTDRIDFQDYSEQSVELSESQQQEAKRLAKLLLQTSTGQETRESIDNEAETNETN